MNKLVVIACLLTFSTISSLAQIAHEKMELTPVAIKPVKIIPPKPKPCLSFSDVHPVFYIDGLETQWGSFAINKDHIKSMHVYQPKKAERKFGAKGEHGVIVINTVEGT